MDICRDGHAEIVFEDQDGVGYSSCPLCEAMKEIEGLAETLKKLIAEKLKKEGCEMLDYDEILKAANERYNKARKKEFGYALLDPYAEASRIKCALAALVDAINKENKNGE